jgi:hypothetical protein
LAGAEIVPELKKILTPQEVAEETQRFLLDDQLHDQTATRLRATMGGTGAVEGLLGLVEEVL